MEVDFEPFIDRVRGMESGIWLYDGVKRNDVKHLFNISTSFPVTFAV